MRSFNPLWPSEHGKGSRVNGQEPDEIQRGTKPLLSVRDSYVTRSGPAQQVGHLGGLLFGTFLLATQEKGTRAFVIAI